MGGAAFEPRECRREPREWYRLRWSFLCSGCGVQSVGQSSHTESHLAPPPPIVHSPLLDACLGGGRGWDVDRRRGRWAVAGVSWVESKLQGSGGEPSIRVIKTLRCQRTLNWWRRFPALAQTHVLLPPRATHPAFHRTTASPSHRRALHAHDSPSSTLTAPIQRVVRPLAGHRAFLILSDTGLAHHHHSLPRGPGKPLSTTPH